MTAVNAPTHTPGVGYVFDGVDQSINSGYNPADDGINYVLDDSLLGGFLTTVGVKTTVSGIFGEIITAPNSFLREIKDNTEILFGINSANNTQTSSLSSDSLYLITRITSSNIEVFENAASIFDVAQVSTTLAQNSLSIGSDGSNFFDGTISGFIAGAAIGFNHSNYHSNLVTLNTGLAAI